MFGFLFGYLFGELIRGDSESHSPSYDWVDMEGVDTKSVNPYLGYLTDNK